MKHIRYFTAQLVAVILMFAVQGAKADQTYISASIDSAVMWIGQQNRISLEITADREKVLQLPIFTDTIVSGIEVLQNYPIDTTLLDNNRMQLRQSMLITSFDSALYYIPPFKVIDGLDTVFSNSLALKTATISIEYPQEAEIFDVKPPWKPKFVLSDYTWWILTPLLLLLLVFIVVTVTKYLINRLRKKDIETVPEIQIPPHERALGALDEIKKEKIWQQGRFKEYYTQLTEVLRVYLDGRYAIDAMEMTTSEILEETRNIKEVRPVFDRFKELLMTADFVKFAKYIPASDENEMLLTSAYLFVETTGETVEKKESNEEINSSKISNKEDTGLIKN